MEIQESELNVVKIARVLELKVEVTDIFTLSLMDENMCRSGMLIFVSAQNEHLFP